MEEFDSFIILRDIDYHSLKFNPGFDFYKDLDKKYLIISESDELLNEIQLIGKRKIINKVYIRNPLSENEFLEADYDFDFEKEYEHKLKMLFKILGAKYYNRILINGEVEKKAIDFKTDFKGEGNLSNPLLKAEAGTEAGLDIKSKKEDILMKKSKFSEKYKITNTINPKEAYRKAYNYAKKNNLLVFQDVKHFLESFDPSISSSRPTEIDDVTISFDSITRIYEAGISLGLKCGLIIVPKKIETANTLELNFGISYIYNKNRDKKKVRKIEVHFGDENE